MMVKPFYFGSEGAPLFGLYHAPQGRPAERAVLLCHPLPQEYGAVHWAFRRLASLLSQRGAHVLRFDYRGTGDSSGENADATFEAMVEDTHVAARELLDLSGLRRVSVVGMRFGAAVLARATDLKVRDAVLWEPVLRGREHLEELRRVHANRERSWLLPVKRSRTGSEDVLGYPLSEPVKRSLESVDLSQGPYVGARRFTLVVSEDCAEHRELERALGRAVAMGTDVGDDSRRTVRLVLAEERSRDTASKEGAALVSNSILRHVADALLPEEPGDSVAEGLAGSSTDERRVRA